MPKCQQVHNGNSAALNFSAHKRVLTDNLMALHGLRVGMVSRYSDLTAIQQQQQSVCGRLTCVGE